MTPSDTRYFAADLRGNNPAIDPVRNAGDGAMRGLRNRVEDHIFAAERRGCPWGTVPVAETQPSLHIADLAVAIELAGDGLVTLDTSWRYTYVNARAELILGQSADELLGQTVFEVYPQFISRSAFPYFFRAMEQRLPYSSELYSDFLDCWLEIHCLPAQEGGVLVLFRDISLRRLRQEALRDALETQQRRQGELKRTEARLRALVRASASATVMAWTADAAGNATAAIRDLPTTWCAFTGQLPEQMRNQGWLAAVHPDDWAPVWLLWKKSLTSGEVYEAKYRVRRHDGDWRYIQSRGVPVYDTDGVVVEWVVTCTDTTAADGTDGIPSSTDTDAD